MLTKSEPLQSALALPNGARFVRCALQVNPLAYILRHKKPTGYKSEDEYNKGMIAACLESGVEAIAVTDHYRVKDSVGLMRTAREAGIHAFGGFEAVSKDGVHFLCLFDHDKDEMIERFIGSCGVHNQNDVSPIGSLDSQTLLKNVMDWGGIAIAAHVAADQGGLLKKLSGETRIKVWKSEQLLACGLPGTADAAPQAIRDILKNKDGQHHRDRPVALINCQDVSDPKGFKEAASTTHIKMSEITIEALRQAFLDPESRIRLNSDEAPEPHIEFLAMSWEGGFLGDIKIHFNANLNALIGGRGAGKSTIIESLRYVLGLDPVGEEASATHEGFIEHVLRGGTKISLLVRSPHPAPRTYTIERTVSV